MDPLWIVIAFILGFGARQIGLPPMVGFLTAGFVLHALGASGGEIIERISDLGVYLLLFSIGLKLRVRSLLRPEIWAVATLHMGVTVVVLSAALLGLGVADLGIFGALDLKLAVLIAFALSFSSTVFAVKILEEKGEMQSVHGRVTIGILIMQDIFAIAFMTLSSGKVPSVWAMLLLALPLLRPLLYALMNRCGHGELLVLLGLLMALGSAELFGALRLKPDLGPLLFGLLVGQHAKSDELSKTLLGFKDLFLTGFFLSIGLSGAPTLGALGLAALLVLAVPLKVALFFWLMTRFKLRARSSLLSSFGLANYSEFGLIVGMVGVECKWIGSEWLVLIAIALTLTFVLASPLNTTAHALYARLHVGLQRFEGSERIRDERPIDIGDAEVVIFGMGRIGTGAYDYMRERYGDRVLGIDMRASTVQKQREVGRTVLQGDATDADFWQRSGPGEVRLVMLAMASHAANLDAVRRIADSPYAGLVAASAVHDDELQELERAGVNAVFNHYREAGAGFAECVTSKFKDVMVPRNGPGSTSPFDTLLS